MQGGVGNSQKCTQVLFLTSINVIGIWVTITMTYFTSDQKVNWSENFKPSDLSRIGKEILAAQFLRGLT